jgi:hypothetical protein
MIDSALDAGRAAARVYLDVDRALEDWPLIEAFREGFGQEAATSDAPPPPQLVLLGSDRTPISRPLASAS